jgi:glycosyltransferase involved in cell wall biosynthesis
MKNILLSVVVCTYNRSKLLKYCLKCLCHQKLEARNYEIIVVDNNSTDNTDEIIRSYLKGKAQIKYFKEKHQGLSHARNRGCNEAQGKYLAYIDDDCIVSRNYLRNVFAIIEENEVDIMGGPIYPYYTEKRPSWFRDRYEIRKYEEQSGFSKCCRISGGNFIIRRDLLKKIGRFDTEMGMKGNKIRLGEDAKILENYRFITPKERQKVYYDLNCFVLHHVPGYKMRLKYVIKRSYISGKMYVELMSRYRGVSLLEILKIFSKLTVGTTIREIRLDGFMRVDLIQLGKQFSKSVGVIVEGVARLRKSNSSVTEISMQNYGN